MKLNAEQIKYPRKGIFDHEYQRVPRNHRMFKLQSNMNQGVKL